MLFPEPADPKLLMHRNQDVSNDSDQRLMNYAAAMIDTLVHERDLARTAHQSLLLDAKAQIAALEAELAHRDLELEKCISHCVDCPEFQRSRTGFEPFTPMEPSVLSKILQKTSTRHKILELGNQQLKGQVRTIQLDANHNQSYIILYLLVLAGKSQAEYIGSTGFNPTN